MMTLETVRLFIFAQQSHRVMAVSMAQAPAAAAKADRLRLLPLAPMVEQKQNSKKMKTTSFSLHLLSKNLYLCLGLNLEILPSLKLSNRCLS